MSVSEFFSLMLDWKKEANPSMTLKQFNELKKALEGI